PRYLRPALADLGTGALVALSATAIVAIVALFLRRARYFLHDFHHLFPKAAARWQSGAMAGLLLVIPVVLHLGLVPVLVLPLAAVALYLTLGERIVAAALVALLGVVPVLGGLLAENTAFAGTVAEDVYRLERGGLAASAAAQRVLKRHADNKAEFPELFALARYEMRRGQLDVAVDHFKLAATKQNNEARLLTNLGNALLTRGDTDGALELYTSATQADGTLAAPFYNLSKLLSRRAAALPDEAVGLELDKAHNAMITATSLDNALFSRDDRVSAAETLSNRLLLSPTLQPAEIAKLASSEESGRKVQAQLSRVLLGTAGSTFAFIYPLVLAGLVVALGQAALMLGAARACDKCGRSVCRRCDKELGVGSALCGQCVNVYARKGVVPAPLKVRKQLEVDRYRAREGRLSYVLGLLCSGAGHLFSGLPVRGAIYVFLFAFTVFHAVFRQGVVRSPFGSMPLTWRLVPVGLLLLSVYLLSLRGLYKRQTE
ncbi:MAG TPA: tetratricopeptide repeat protein, partial [Myxococcaceae bacterium]|nr:tetratricopeptide repeat protein [Myxococcaceae bacterium]